MRRFTTLFLMCIYLLPVIAGQQGVHTLLGVEHVCCQHSGGMADQTSHTSGCCQSHAQRHHHVGHPHHHGQGASCCSDQPKNAEANSPRRDQENTPRPKAPAHDEECFLCQQLSHAQLSSPAVQILSLWESLELTLQHCMHDPLLVVLLPHAPRGPPAV